MNITLLNDGRRSGVCAGAGGGVAASGRKNNKEPRRPVSERFYSDVSRRIAVAASYLSDPAMQAKKSLMQVDVYLETGREPSMADGLDSMIIFRMIQPELDRAKARSLRAREVAERRRRQKLHQEAESVENQTAAADSDAVAVDVAKPATTGSGRDAFQSVLRQAIDSKAIAGALKSVPTEAHRSATRSVHDRSAGGELLAVPDVGQGRLEVALDHGVDILVEEAREVVGQGQLGGRWVDAVGG